MSRRRTPASRPDVPATMPDYDAILAELVGLLESSRRVAARAVNAVMTATYWEIGRRVVEYEQGGDGRADYGSVLVRRLAIDLTQRFGRGFGKSNLYQMRGFYLAYDQIFQTVSGKLDVASHLELVNHFPLPWSHYIQLLKIL